MFRQFVITVVLASITLAACGGSSTTVAPTTAPGSTSAPAATATPAKRTAQVDELQNTVDARDSANADWSVAAEGQAIPSGGGVRTGNAAHARVAISDGTILRLASDTEFQLTELSPAPDNPVTRIALAAGKIWTVVTGLGGGSFEIEAPSGVATVRGSFMSVEFYPLNGQMIATCLEGVCRLTGRSGRFINLRTGQQAGIPGFDQDPVGPKELDISQLEDWQENFPEATQIIPTITPGPRPTETSTPPAGGGLGVGQTACDHAYFPLRAGAEWTYSSPIGPMTIRVDSVTGDTESAEAVMSSSANNVTATYTWECTAQNGLVSYDFASFGGAQFPGTVTMDVTNASGAFLPPADLLVPGYAWNNDFTLNMNVDVQNQTMTVVSDRAEQRSVTGVGTATFDGQEYAAITISGNATSKTATTVGGFNTPGIESNDTSISVFARGVGMTTWTTTSTSEGQTYSTTYELTSYTPGK